MKLGVSVTPPLFNVPLLSCTPTPQTVFQFGCTPKLRRVTRWRHGRSRAGELKKEEEEWTKEDNDLMAGAKHNT